MHAYLAKLQQTFHQLDAHRAGKLGLQQVQAALQMLDFDLDMQPGGAFYKLAQSFDFNMDGLIRLDSFIAMCIQLRNEGVVLLITSEPREHHRVLVPVAKERGEG